MNGAPDQFDDRMPTCQAEGNPHNPSNVAPENPALDRIGSRLKFIAYYESKLDQLAVRSGIVPQFSGHYQPRLPAAPELHDLQSERALEQQIALAKAHGISGFCFRYYWSNGDGVPQWPLNVVERRRDLEFPFCISWEGEAGADLSTGLKQERRPRRSSDREEQFIDNALHYVDDPRYITIDGRPLLLASCLADPHASAERWRQIARQRGTDLFLVQGLALKAIHHDGICGFDALVQDPSRWLEFLDGADFPRADRPTFCGKIYDYTSLADRACAELEAQEFPTIPCVVAGLDDAPSRGRFANCLINSTPANYQNWLMEAAFDAAHRPIFGASYVFINSWNDWPKGAYLEPDQKYGDAFLRVTADALLPYSAARSRAVARTNKPVVITSFLPEVFTPKSKTAIIIHAFYPDVLDDLLKRLQPCNGRDIFISVVEENAEHLLAVIARHVKDACVYVVPNCGRDARPFLHMLKVVNQFGYESFVKLHTKKSSHTTVGSEWYAALVPPLVELCRPNRLSQILQAHPNVSLIGTAGLILDGSTYMGSSGNIAWLQRLCHELDIRSVPSAFAFVAGTMFGARLAPFQRLIENDFVGMMFEEELGQRDGTLAHALERLFGLLIAWRSETIASVAMVEDELVVDAADQSFVAALMFQKRSKDWKFHVKRLSP